MISLDVCKKGLSLVPQTLGLFPSSCGFYVQDCYTIRPQRLPPCAWFMCFPQSLRFSLYLPSFFLLFVLTLLILLSFIIVFDNRFPIISFFCLFQKVRFSCFFLWRVLITSRRGAALGTRCSWRWSLEVAWWCFGIGWCHLWHPMQCHLVRLKRSAEII